MNDCQRLHETIVRDIWDVVNDVRKFDQVEWMRTRHNTGSIARRASNLILVFPVIVSNSLSYQTAVMMSKAIERKCASLMYILFNAIQFSDADNLYDYINRFHSNLNLKSGFTLDDMIDAIDAISAEESADITITDREAFDMVREDMKNLNFYLSTEYNPIAINDYKVVKNYYGESTVVLEAPGTIARNGVNNNGASRSGADLARFAKDQSDFFKASLTQFDINKANELMPTTIMVNFMYSTDNGSLASQMSPVGIKAKLYLVESTEIVNRVVAKYNDSNGLFNLVRASTREISFFKDLAFAIDKAKLDAVNMAKDSNNARIFKVLERRAAKNRFSTLMKRNDASPITSMVISQDEVEYLKKYYSIDMEMPYVTRSLLEKYNLMDIIIADETLEIAKMLFDDGDGIFDTLTFDALEKEAKDNSYKKVVNLMSKMNR